VNNEYMKLFYYNLKWNRTHKAYEFSLIDGFKFESKVELYPKGFHKYRKYGNYDVVLEGKDRIKISRYDRDEWYYLTKDRAYKDAKKEAHKKGRPIMSMEDSDEVLRKRELRELRRTERGLLERLKKIQSRQEVLADGYVEDIEDKVRIKDAQEVKKEIIMERLKK
jgi:hypothetical protein